MQFLIAPRIAQTMKPYSEGDFVKICLTDVAEEMGLGVRK